MRMYSQKPLAPCDIRRQHEITSQKVTNGIKNNENTK
jgi:hypothetical protein